MKEIPTGLSYGT